MKNFDKSVRDEKAKGFVAQGNVAKFRQNLDLKELLLQTAGTTLVECSPFDRISRVGMSAKNPKAQSRSTWLGKNWSGEALTEGREKLANE